MEMEKLLLGSYYFKLMKFRELCFVIVTPSKRLGELCFVIVTPSEWLREFVFCYSYTEWLGVMKIRTY